MPLAQSETQNGITFSFFGALVRRIARETAPTSRKKPRNPIESLNEWLSRLRTDFSPVPDGTTSIILRFLFPHEDKRRIFDMQEKALSKEIGKALGVADERFIYWDVMGETTCLGEQLERVLERSCSDLDEITPLSLKAVDALLDELAAMSRFTDPRIKAKFPKRNRRKREDILKELFRPMSPSDAACLTQVILKDVRPLMYPLCEKQMHYTAALKDFKSNCVIELSRFSAMKAWDPSLSLLKSHRVCSSLEDAAAAFERGKAMSVPVLGVQIEIPKSQKGRNLSHALSCIPNSRSVWAETKYDGERAQIHIQLTNGVPRIKIFSKSGRDSTNDRAAVHPIILECLSNSNVGNIILDAEMVACNGKTIESFWKIRPLIEKTAVGARRKVPEEVEEETQDTQFTQSSAESDCPSHLALVFFDVMFLDGESLMSKAYTERRRILEAAVQQIPGKVMLAERWEIPMSTRKTGGLGSWARPSKRALESRKEDEVASPENTLGTVFTEILASYKEGLVLKAAESTYNDWKLPWVKLKMDYIPNLGDTVDLVILGAGWRKDRGAELRVPRTTFTTFFVGALRNPEDLKANSSARPHFHLYFTVSYGLSRDQLEEINFLVKSKDPVSLSSQEMPKLPYDYTIDTHEHPQVLLQEPLLAEIFGDRFTKKHDRAPFEVRWPRILKIHRSGDRHWTEGIPFDQLQGIAAAAVGSDQDVAEDVARMWIREGSVKPGDDLEARRRKWEKRLGVKSRMAPERDVQTSRSPQKRRRLLVDRGQDNGAAEELNGPPSPSQPLRTTTNLPDHSTPIPDSQKDSQSEESFSAPRNCTPLPVITSSATRRKYPSPPLTSPVATPTPSPLIPADVNNSRDENEFEYQVRAENVEPETKFSNVDFLQNAVIWYDPTSPLIPESEQNIQDSTTVQMHLQNNRIHEPEALLTGCGWHPKTRGSPWVDKAVVFLDPTTHSSRTFEKVLLSLLKTRLESVPQPARKPIWIFDRRTFRWSEPYRGQVLTTLT
ncbi:hypothetical protein PM082_010786 [Marasmius tenuissimus]|nr:hypothetical protein PM082_010786 [Marasmius tenuissimus]